MSHSSSIRNLFLLAQGHFITTLGTRTFEVAMLLWIKQATGSAALMGLLMLFTSLPAAVLAPFGGAFADRFGRLRVIIGADLVSAAAVAMVFAVLVFDPDPISIVIALCVGNAVLGLVGAGFGPAVNALIPTIAPGGRLERANAAFRFSQTGGGALGQGLGGFLFGAVGFGGTLAINAVSFALSALSESWIRLPPQTEGHANEAPPARDQTAVRRLGTIWAATIATTRKLLQVRRTRTLLLMIAAFHLCFASLPIVMPYYVERVLRLGSTWYGVYMAMLSIGILVGFVVSGLLKPAQNRLRRAALAAFGVAITFGILAVAPSMLACALALAGIGAGIGIIVVTLMTELQVIAPENERAAAMGAAQAVGDSSIPIGMAVTGLILDALLKLEMPADLPVRWFIAAAALLATFAALTGLWGMKKAC